MRGHLNAFGFVVRPGAGHVAKLIDWVGDPTGAAARDGSRARPWLAQMLARKPRMLVPAALANKTARIVWALLAGGGVYRAPVVAA